MQQKTKIRAALAIVALGMLVSAGQADKVISKEDGATVVNTTTLTKNVRGYQGPTPVKIYIKGNKIQKVEPLKNQESPQYFARAKKLLTQYEGMTVAKAQKQQVDAVSGATLSSNALKKNVTMGLKYYKDNK